MKKALKKLAKQVFYFGYRIFPAKLFTLINLRINQLYTLWKVNEFKNVGDDAYIQYPMYLWGGKFITIGNEFRASLRLRLEAYDEHLGHTFSPKILIGNRVSINSDCHIGAINEIIIEDDVLIASKVFITDHYHGEITKEAIKLAPPNKRKLYSKGTVKIEKNVWIGEGVVILPNVIIGENSIIGANSVVVKSIPKNSVAGGNPAKVLRTL